MTSSFQKIQEGLSEAIEHVKSLPLSEFERMFEGHFPDCEAQKAVEAHHDRKPVQRPQPNQIGKSQ